MKPLVTVLMPMRNAERFVAESLRSVLDQQSEAFELQVVVINDGSTDESAAKVLGLNDSRIRLIAGPQRGISAAFNAGLTEVRGQIVARCDADDLYPSGRLEWQVSWLNEHPDVGAVCGYYSTIDDAGNLITEHSHDEPAAEVTQELRTGRGRSHMCAYAFRTEMLRSIGGCREWFVTSEDADLQYRLAEVTRVWFEPRAAYLYRLHGSSVTHQQPSPARVFYERTARQFQEQRRTTGQDDLQRGHPPAVPAELLEYAAPMHPKQQIQQILLGRAWNEHAAGNKRRAVITGLRACWARPLNPGAWKSLIALIVKPTGALE